MWVAMRDILPCFTGRDDNRSGYAVRHAASEKSKDSLQRIRALSKNDYTRDQQWQTIDLAVSTARTGTTMYIVSCFRETRRILEGFRIPFISLRLKGLLKQQ